MIIQKSYKNENKTLYIIPTPIGNLEDLTLRSINILKNEVEILFCEDTRVSVKILNHLNITIPLKSYHDHNSEKGDMQILTALEAGKNVGLVSDAGMPGISDPGFSIIKQVKKNGFNVVVLPGATAFVLPVVHSVFATFKFTYYGFLDKNSNKKTKQLEEILKTNTPTVVYESPHKVLKTLEIIVTLDPKIELCLGRELSKINEEYISGTSTDICNHFTDNPIRGEFVIVIGVKNQEPITIEPFERYSELINQGETKNNAIKITAKEHKVSKNEIYQLVLKKEHKHE